MIKRELKDNLKGFILWTSILIGIFLVVFLIYPYIITDDSMHNLDEMMKLFPEELLKAFNMDLSSISTAYGWLKSEGFMFIMIIIGFYASFLGYNIVLKEEYDKTIEYLSFVPIKRSKMVTNKVLVGFIYITAMTLITGLFNYICLLILGDFNQKEYLLLSITPLLIAYPLFSLNLFISTFIHKSKKNIGISLGLVFIFYIFNILSELSTKVEFLKYFSIYTLADTRNIMTNQTINIFCILISIGLTLVLLVLSYLKYDKKELVC